MPCTRSSQTRTLRTREQAESASRRGTGARHPRPEDTSTPAPPRTSGPDGGGLTSTTCPLRTEPRTPVPTPNTRVQSPPGSTDPRGSANPLSDRPRPEPEPSPSVTNAEQGTKENPVSTTSPGVPLPGPEGSEIYQMLRELCEGQSQIKQRLDAVEDRSPRSQTHGTPTEPEQTPANDYPPRGSTQSGEPPQGRTPPRWNRARAEWPRTTPYGHDDDHTAPNGTPHGPDTSHNSWETGSKHPSHEAKLTAWLDELTALSKGVDRCDETNCRTWKEKNNLLI